MMENLIPILVFFSVIGSGIAAFIFGRSHFAKLDRRRITENLIQNGGEVLNIELHSPPRIGNRSDNVYDVTFKTRRGKRITTMCMTSVTSGVVWISDKPPEDGIEVSDEPVPTESISCLQCGAKISPNASRCPQCGWSYTQA
ncbi:MAG TPA: zinc ribbon domain-containing protein [Candidatus Angelobacter sp.]|nr:zinc ribbon domain-containing protein [Candidatus Angelobacter sp.]